MIDDEHDLNKRCELYKEFVAYLLSQEIKFKIKVDKIEQMLNNTKIELNS